MPAVTADHPWLSHLLETEKPRAGRARPISPGTRRMADGDESRTGDLPVIFISGYERDRDRRGGAEAGAEDYIGTLSATELKARIGFGAARRAEPNPSCWARSRLD